MHTETCLSCLTVKRTGLSMKAFDKWKKHFDRRPAMQKSIAMLTSSHDFSLLEDKICSDCIVTQQVCSAYRIKLKAVA